MSPYNPRGSGLFPEPTSFNDTPDQYYDSPSEPQPTTRVIVCRECGGDGGWDVPCDVNYFNGALITRWSDCRACDGNGEIEVDVEPVTQEELG